MSNTILSLHPIIGIVIVAILVILIGLVGYLLGRWLIVRSPDTEDKSTAINLQRSVSVLLGLILSISFAFTRSGIVKIETNMELEATQIRNIHAYLGRFGSPKANRIKTKLLEYTQLAMDEEWQGLAQGRLNQMSWDLFSDIENSLLNLRPANANQELLKERMIIDMDEMIEYRTIRILASRVRTPSAVPVVLVGFLISSFLLCVHPLRKSTLIFLSSYAAFIGIVVYFLIALNHPFLGIKKVSPQPFQIVYRALSSETSR